MINYFDVRNFNILSDDVKNLLTLLETALLKSNFVLQTLSEISDYGNRVTLSYGNVADIIVTNKNIYVNYYVNGEKEVNILNKHELLTFFLSDRARKIKNDIDAYNNMQEGV